MVLSLILFIALWMSSRTIAQEPVQPTAVPDAEAGLAIYSERCTVCHGETGAGDGQQAVNAGLQPAAFTDPEYRLNANPQVMFDVIANGNMASGMPPFGEASSNPLSAASIWDLIAAAYSFSTPPESIALGEELVMAQEGVQLPDAAYWFTHSNAEAIADLVAGEFGFAAAALSAEEQMAVVDYGRSQTYTYIDPFAPPEPIELGVIGGQVINGTSLEPVAEGTATLRGFTFDLEEMVNQSAALDAEGMFEFTVTDVSPDLVYIVDVDYGDLSFNSNANQLTRANPALELPVIVYETTTDVSGINIGQLHVIFNLTEGQLNVSEFYVFNNEDTAVFIGETGSADDGVIDISLPAGAQNVSFERAFGGFDRFVPANEVIQTETGWADTVPIQPGAASANLLVSYTLPYEDSLRLAHPVAYPINSASATIPDVGVEIEGDNWVAQGGQTTPGGNILSYVNADMANADTLNIALSGKPQLVRDAQGNTLLVRDHNQELVIGSIVFLLAVAIAGIVLYRWQHPTTNQQDEAEELLYAIADLDDAFEAGELEESSYQHQREQLKGDLAAIWQTR